MTGNGWGEDRQGARSRTRSAPVAPALRGQQTRAAAVRTTERGWLGGRMLHHAIPVIAAAIVSSGALLGGYNSAAGNAVACIVTAALLILLLLAEPPSFAMWRSAAPILAVIGASVAWVLFAAIMVPPLAPDLWEPQMLGIGATIAALLSGWVIGLVPKRIPAVLDLLLGFNSLYLLAGLAIRSSDLGSRFDFWTTSWHGRFAGTIGNSNATAAVAGSVAVIALARLLATVPSGGRRMQDRERLRQAGYGFYLLIALGAALATASRLAALATAIALAGLTIWGVVRHRRRIPRILPVLGGVAVLLMVLLGWYADLLAQRYQAIGVEFSARERMWSHYWELAQASIWFGYGHGSFATLNAFSLHDIATAEALSPVNSAHDIGLQMLLNAGLPYVLLVSVAAGLVIARMVAHSRSRLWSLDLTGIVLALSVIFAVALIDIVLDVPATTILALFLGGLLWGRADARLSHLAPAKDAPAQH